MKQSKESSLLPEQETALPKNPAEYMDGVFTGIFSLRAKIIDLTGIDFIEDANEQIETKLNKGKWDANTRREIKHHLQELAAHFQLVINLFSANPLLAEKKELIEEFRAHYTKIHSYAYKE